MATKKSKLMGRMEAARKGWRSRKRMARQKAKITKMIDPVRLYADSAKHAMSVAEDLMQARKADNLE
jgi:hypothetical protein